MQNPLVTVIIPTYNREIYLEEAITSVVNQTYNNIEIIVVDDGSETNYAESICQKNKNCRYLYKKNGGLSSARNFGIENAKGEFIAFLDDDDFWEISKIKKQMQILTDNANIDCVHSAAAVVDEIGNMTGQTIGAASNKVHKRTGYVFWNALGTWVVKSPTPLIRKKVFTTDMIFDEDIKVGEDVDFYQRMFYRHKVHYIDEPLAFYREYDNQKRLSLQKKKYIGIEKKMFENFKRMGIKNPIVLYRIAIKLLLRAQQRWSEVYGEESANINKIDLYLRPVFCLNKYFNEIKGL